MVQPGFIGMYYEDVAIPFDFLTIFEILRDLVRYFDIHNTQFAPLKGKTIEFNLLWSSISSC